MDITVVAPTYQRAERLRRLLRALEEQDHPKERFGVIIVDDCSTDATSTLLDEACRTSDLQLDAVRMLRNGGPAPARNTGWRRTRSEVVAFIDDDCTPAPGWVTAMVRAFERNDRLGVAQGCTKAAEGQRGTWTVAREIGIDTPWFEGCNIAYRRAALEATGGFDEVVGWYGEDAAAGWKVVDAGWERDFVPEAVVTHDLEERGIRWRIRHGWLEGNLVELAARHPGLRAAAFPRPWTFRQESVTFPLALLGLVGALRRPALLALAVPYLFDRRELLRRPRDLAAFALVDAAAVAGHLRASARSGIFVL